MASKCRQLGRRETGAHLAPAVDERIPIALSYRIIAFLFYSIFSKLRPPQVFKPEKTPSFLRPSQIYALPVQDDQIVNVPGHNFEKILYHFYRRGR